MKKKTLTAVAVLASIIAGASVLAVAETKTHFLSEMLEEEHVSNGKYAVAFNQIVAEETSEKETLKQEVELADENSPFEKMTLNYYLYGDEKTPASITITDSGILFFSNFLINSASMYQLEVVLYQTFPSSTSKVIVSPVYNVSSL